MATGFYEITGTTLAGFLLHLPVPGRSAVPNFRRLARTDRSACVPQRKPAVPRIRSRGTV